MRFMYWWRMQEFVRKRMKVPNTMLVRHEMVIYLHGFRERGEGWEVGNRGGCVEEVERVCLNHYRCMIELYALLGMYA